MRKTIITLMAMVLSLTSVFAVRSPYIIDSLQARLKTLAAPSDSLATLLDILDLAGGSTSARLRLSAEIYDVASRTGDSLHMIESLSYRANAALYDSTKLDEVSAELERFAPSPRVNEARLFARMLRARNRILNGSRPDSDELSSLIQKASMPMEMNDYEHAMLLFNICLGLSDETSGPLLEKYYDRLITLIERMDLPMGSVRNMVYNFAATAFSNNEMWPKSVTINKKLIHIVDSLSEDYSRRGRKFRNFDRFRYMYYRRLLICHQGLSPTEVETYHRAIHNMAQTNDEIRNDIDSNPMVHAFYLSATGKYAEAIPLLEKSLVVPVNRYYLYRLYSELYVAAEKSGNSAVQLQASKGLNRIFRDLLESKENERYRELQIMCDVGELESRNNELETLRRRTQLRTTYAVAGISGVAVILLSLLLFVLWKRNQKMHRMSMELEATAENLRNERNDLHRVKEDLIVASDMAKSADKTKAEFIDNITHEIKTPLTAVSEYSRLIVDCIPEDQNKYLRKFADIIELNTKLLSTLIDDLLDTSALEHGKMTMLIEGASVYRMCTVALGNVFEGIKSANSAVEVVFNPSGKPDRIVSTDRQRVVQVLCNLLDNASKFTEKGSITLDFDVDETARTMTFSVTDTGCGISREREEDIFRRFNHTGSSSQGIGIGLYISRLLAQLLGGSLRLDTDYRRGARFLFTIPI